MESVESGAEVKTRGQRQQGATGQPGNMRNQEENSRVSGQKNTGTQTMDEGRGQSGTNQQRQTGDLN